MERPSLRVGCVYLARNKVNGKVYIGQTSQPLHRRISQHFSDAKQKKPFKFCRAINKYGKQAFEWEVIAEGLIGEELDVVEKAMVAYYDSISSGYNLKPGGWGGFRPTLSETSRQKLSSSLKRAVCSTRYKPGDNSGCSNTMAVEAVRDKVSIATVKNLLVAVSSDVVHIYFGQSHAKAQGYTQPQISRARSRRGTYKGFRWLTLSEYEAEVGCECVYLRLLWHRFKSGVIKPQRIERLVCVAGNPSPKK